MAIPAATLERPPAPADRQRPKQSVIDDLAGYLTHEIEDALAARMPIEFLWRDCLRMYDGVPENPVRDTPIPNAPNLEVPVGAIAADAIYAQAVDTIFQISPTVTVRPTTAPFKAHADALQRFINWGVANEWNLRDSVAHALLDDTQLGTAVFYVPWIEVRRKTPSFDRINLAAPVIRTVPLEDFIVPGAAPADLQNARWVALRQWLTTPELNLRAKNLDWDIEGVLPVAARDMVRQRRHMLGRTADTGEQKREMYEILDVYIHYDIDGDGIAEDLLVTWDRSSRHILRMIPNPFDSGRPFASMVYQPRPHQFFGIGILEMLRAFEKETTEIHNSRILNMLLANTRVWIGREGVIQETMEIWPNKVITVPDPDKDFKALQMADIYPSSSQAEAIVMNYAERRSGVNDITSQRQAMSNRTPGITALSFIQQVNQRFMPAFDAMRMGIANAVMQCCFRYQERVQLNDPMVLDKINRVLGPADGNLVIALLRDPDFEHAVAVELTASSSTINRDADRQNSIMLMNMLSQYYQQLLQLVQLAATPGLPPPVAAAALKIIDAAAEALDRTVRTFDTIRDPAAFVLRADEIFQQQAGPVQQLGPLLQAMAGAGASAAGPGVVGSPEAPAGPQLPSPPPGGGIPGAPGGMIVQ